LVAFSSHIDHWAPGVVFVQGIAFSDALPTPIAEQLLDGLDSWTAVVPGGTGVASVVSLSSTLASVRARLVVSSVLRIW